MCMIDCLYNNMLKLINFDNLPDVDKKFCSLFSGSRNHIAVSAHDDILLCDAWMTRIYNYR